MFTHAIVRTPGPDFANGITTANLGAPDHATMHAQHTAYIAALRQVGLEVTVLDPLPGFPDAYFVEDAAVLTPELAVITRPGAVARRGEETAIAATLARRKKPIALISEPATLEGGDVLIIDDRVFVGLTSRTNQAGADQLATLLARQGFSVTTVPIREGLHLKSFVNTLGERRVLIAEELAGHPAFASFERVVVDRDETYACNVLFINGTVMAPRGFPKTQAKLEKLGLPLVMLETSEARRMDGGLTCLSLRY